MKRHPLRLLLGTSLVGLGFYWVWDGLRRTLPPPPPMAYLGPLRFVALPFLWSEWGEARREGRLREATEYGKWITFLLPGRWDLFIGFAWELAYDLPAPNESPQARAEALVEALLLLEEGMKAHPRVQRLPLLAAFFLQDRILSRKDPALAKAFEDLVGSPPEKAYRSYLERLVRLDSGRQVRDLRHEVSEGFLDEAKELLQGGLSKEAGKLFARAARVLAPTEEARARLFQEVGRALRTRGKLPDSLRARLAKDPFFAK